MAARQFGSWTQRRYISTNEPVSLRGQANEPAIPQHAATVYTARPVHHGIRSSSRRLMRQEGRRSGGCTTN